MICPIEKNVSAGGQFHDVRLAAQCAGWEAPATVTLKRYQMVNHI